MDDIVWVYVTSNGEGVTSLTINLSPSNYLTQIYSNKYDDSSGLRWAFELKSPFLKDKIDDVLLTIVIVSYCVASQFLPVVDVASLPACAAYAQANLGLEIAGYLQDMSSLYETLAPVVSLDSVTMTYSDGSSHTVPSSGLSIQGGIAGTNYLPTFLDTLNQLVTKQNNGQLVSVHSPVRLLVVDSSGRRVGEDANGQIFGEIPGAFFLGPGIGHLVYLPTTITNYNVELTGTESGNYGLQVTYLSSSVKTNQVTGQISSGQQVTYSVTASNQEISMSGENSGGILGTDTMTILATAVVTALVVLIGSEVLLRRRRSR
jgi:hypothetical protein